MDKSPNKSGNIANDRPICDHSIRIESLCALCGFDVSGDTLKVVPTSHSSDKILQTEKSAKKLQKRKNRKLFKERKLILILDLDQTILHTTNQKSSCDFIFKLDGVVHYVKLRPFLNIFLEKASKMFDIHVYTMGIREYAKIICNKIDPDGKYFGDRIVSRSENFNEFKKSIQRITCIPNNVIILDDRADVWNYDGHLIMIRPFWYHDRIDINDPAKLKRNEDLIEVTTFTINPDQLIKDEQFETDTCDINMINSLENSIIIGGDTNNKEINNENNLTKSSDLMSKITDQENEILNSAKCDNELLNIINLFERIHRKFFKNYLAGKKKMNTETLLKIKAFKHIRIAGNPIFYPLFRFLGCTIDYENPGFSIRDESIARAKKIPNLTIDWIFECIFQRRVVDYRNFVISDFTGEDDYFKELENEFF